MLQRSLESISRFLQAEDGPTAVEYAVMLALIIIACVASIGILGNNVNETYSSFGEDAFGKSSN